MEWFGRKFTLVVVCKANITRSAYLHGYMEHYLKKHLPHARKKVRILSAGVNARRGGSASQVVQHVAKLKGFNLESHHSGPLTKKLVGRADAILVMEQYQKDAILERFPQAMDKTFRMMEYLGNDNAAASCDIPDPTGQDTAAYEEFIAVAHAEVERIFRELAREGIL